MFLYNFTPTKTHPFGFFHYEFESMKGGNMEKAKQNREPEASPTWIHPHQLITGQDLERFRQRVIIDLAEVIKKHLHITPKKWLKSHEVRKLLKISPGTLQHLKANGTIPFTKIGGVHYFDYEKIQEVLSGGVTTGR